MNFPFTTDQFLAVFEQYNHAVWPLQILLNLLGIVAVVLAVKRTGLSNKIIVATLAFLWMWIGVAYHLAFFSAINPAAYVFAALNVIQGILFLWFGLFAPRLSFGYKTDAYGIVGALLILYALILYPLIGYLLGHTYPSSPTFGLPCPTTIFTFGLLLWTDIKLPKIVVVIPFLWSLIGSMAALKLGIFEDIGLLISGIAGLVLIILRDKTPAESGAEVGRAI